MDPIRASAEALTGVLFEVLFQKFHLDSTGKTKDVSPEPYGIHIPLNIWTWFKRHEGLKFEPFLCLLIHDIRALEILSNGPWKYPESTSSSTDTHFWNVESPHTRSKAPASRLKKPKEIKCLIEVISSSEARRKINQVQLCVHYIQ